MKIFLVITAVLAAFVAFAVILQKQKDNGFLEWLKEQADTIVVKNVRLVHERIRIHDHHSSTQQLCRELLVGSAFVILPTRTPAALYNKASSPEGVSGITWSIPIDRSKVFNEDSLQIECSLPGDENGCFSRITFEGILSNSNRDEILRRLSL